MKKAELEQKKSLAKALYMRDMQQDEIADKVGVSRVTINRWCAEGAWKEQRAALNVTRPELTNKILRAINDILDKVNASDDLSLAGKTSDQLVKLTKVIRQLQQGSTVIDAMDVFMAFSKWLEFRSQTDSELTPELIKTFNKYQDLYINEHMSSGNYTL